MPIWPTTPKDSKRLQLPKITGCILRQRRGRLEERLSEILRPHAVDDPCRFILLPDGDLHNQQDIQNNIPDPDLGRYQSRWT